MAEPEPEPRASGHELEPGEGVHRHGVGLDEGRNVADDRADIATLQERAGTLAQPGDVGPSDRTSEDHDQRDTLGR